MEDIGPEQRKGISKIGSLVTAHLHDREIRDQVTSCEQQLLSVSSIRLQGSDLSIPIDGGLNN